MVNVNRPKATCALLAVRKVNQHMSFNMMKLHFFCYVYQGPLCPCGWDKFLDGCYIFETNKLSWSDARSDCLKRGGDLFLPTSAAQDKSVAEEANSKNLGSAWIGITR